MSKGWLATWTLRRALLLAFKDRRDLLLQLLEYWAHETTEVLSENPELRLVDPRARLFRIAETVLEHDLYRCNLALRAWGAHAGEVASRLASLFRIQLGWERTGYPRVSKKRLRELMHLRLALLTDR